MMAFVATLIGMIILFWIGIRLSANAPYWWKWTVYISTAGFFSLVFIPFMLLRPRCYKNAFIPALFWIKICGALGVTMEIRGLENVHPERGGVIIMNHQSALDLCVLSHLVRVVGKATVVIKKEILYYPFFGLAAYLWGAFFVSKTHKENVDRLKKEAQAIRDQNWKLLIFPEGRRSQEPKLLPFRKGAFHLAIDGEAPIQPIVISKYWFLSSKKQIFKPGHAIIEILPEIESTNFSKENIGEFVEYCHQIMQEKFDQLSVETACYKHED